jgi:hypothetical protein
MRTIKNEVKKGLFLVVILLGVWFAFGAIAEPNTLCMRAILAILSITCAFSARDLYDFVDWSDEYEDEEDDAQTAKVRHCMMGDRK